MTCHDKSHAVGASGCQPNVVQRIISWDDINVVGVSHRPPEEPLVYYTIAGTAPEPEFLSGNNTLVGLPSHSHFQGRKILQIDRFLQCFQRLVLLLAGMMGLLIFWTLRSSFLGCGKRRMDDGGRRGNAPPNAADAKSSELQSGVAA